MADATLLSWITAEVDQALAQVREKIARFSAAPESGSSLNGCPEHLHQVSGALRMVGLAGATRFCEALEGSFHSLTRAPGPAALGLIDRAVLALKEFVGDVSRGERDAPMRLFPVYRELTGMQGGEGSERDLFYPDLAPVPPAHPRPVALAEEAWVPFLHAQRARFQRGLLAALRNQAGGLDELRGALEAVHQAAARLPEPRAIPWVGLGLIDGFAGEQDAAWLAGARALLNRIDFYMRDLEAGLRPASEALLREALYAVATSKHVTEHILAVRELYQLDRQFAQRMQSSSEARDLANLAPTLNDLRSRLDVLKAAWVQYLSGEPKGAQRVRELLAAFKLHSGELGHRPLGRLVEAMALVAGRLPDPYPEEKRQKSFMVMEMASAFLLAEHVLGTYADPPADLDHQITLMGGWLLDAADGKSLGDPPAGLRPDLLQQIGTLQLRAQVAKEVMSNLQHVEEVLDAFARDPGKRDTLHGLESHLRQIHGAFTVLGLERAGDVLTTCETLIAAVAAADYSGAAEDMDWIAEGLSSLGLYLEPCMRGRDPTEAAVARFLGRYENRVSAPRAPLGAGPTAGEGAQPAAASRPEVDTDLLAIYIEEAAEVLGAIAAALAAAESQPEDREALATIRRGFHTLKGSGRMVGLMDLGEAAWQVEQTMNRWLDRGVPASPQLLQLIHEGRIAFAAWLEGLKAGTLQAEVDTTSIVAAAARVDIAEAAEADPAEADAAPAPETPPEEVAIGNVRLSAKLFEVYRGEAEEHVASLQREFLAWHPGTEASPEFLRAAHTLASSSLTAGFAGIAALAAALEKFLPSAKRVTDPGDVRLVEDSLARLRAMVQAVARREPPVSGEEEAASLLALMARPARPAAPAPIGPEKRVVRDDIDDELLPVFLEEAQELLPQIGGDLRAWKAAPADQRISQALRRGLHTLKGSARMAGAIRLGELTHLMESQVEAAIENSRFPVELFVGLEEKMDRLSLDVERMRGAAPASAVVVEPAPQPAEPLLPTPAALLRVNADTLDQLINGSGEISIARSRVEAELRVVKQSLSDLGESTARLRSQLREVEIQADSQLQSRLSVREERVREFDPLEFDRYTRLQELTRLMAESLHDIVSIQQTLARNLGEADAGLLQQSRMTREVQHELMRMRAVPFSNLSERLYRVVRQTARELGKKADLELEGSQVELDRSILERVAAPLEHMLRNALVHGIEPPEARSAAGKLETGRISILLRQESNEIALVLSDDGAGLDLEKLHRKALEKGLLQPGQEVPEAELMQAIFVSGISTAASVSELAGRGVGMDVVRNEIAAMGGRIDITSSRGHGTSFAIYLPLTLAVTHAVLVRAGNSLLAVSSAMVEQVLRLKADAMSAVYEADGVEFQGRRVAIRSLEQLLDGAQSPRIQPYNSVLLLRSGIQRVALHVDELIANQEIVVKSIGPQLARVPGVTGATVLADGTIALIVNPVQLAQRAARAVPAASQAMVPSAPRVLVVDDSLTVRRITGRLLEREGYRVTTAKDGVDALEQLSAALPDVMLVDIEMPRMDGFDLTKHVRADPRSAAIPIIVISSRTAEKHRAHAAQLGVNAFLGKPYQDAELLEHIARYLPR